MRSITAPPTACTSFSVAVCLSGLTIYRTSSIPLAESNLNEYILQTRLKEPILLIEEKQCSFSEGSQVCGFTNAAYFSKAFKKYYDATPSQYFKEKKV